MSAVMGSGPRNKEETLNELNERHRRRVQLMRMQGDIDRQERRVHIMWAVAAVLGAIALLLLAVS
jgi:hypothetical protein